MGNHIASVAIPDEKELTRLKKKSRLSRNDLIEMKDGLKQVAIREGGIMCEDFVDCCVNKLNIDEEEYLTWFYDVFDDEGDDWVDFREVAVYSALTARSRRAKKIEYCYRVFDKNGNGYLDVDEIKSLFEATARALRRCNYVLPGLKTKNPRPDFTLTAKEKGKIARAAEKLFDKVDHELEGEISFVEFRSGSDSVRSIRNVLDYFYAISENLPEEIDRTPGKRTITDSESGPVKDKSKSKSKGKGKAKYSDAGSDSGGAGSSKKSSKKSSKDKKKDKKKGKKKAKDSDESDSGGGDGGSGKMAVGGSRSDSSEEDSEPPAKSKSKSKDKSKGKDKDKGKKKKKKKSA